METVTRQDCETDVEEGMVQCFIEHIVGSFQIVYSALVAEGKVNRELHKDYMEFCALGQKLLSEHRENFKFNLLYKGLPDNKWAPLYEQNIKRVLNNQKAPSIH